MNNAALNAMLNYTNNDSDKYERSLISSKDKNLAEFVYGVPNSFKDSLKSKPFKLTPESEISPFVKNPNK